MFNKFAYAHYLAREAELCLDSSKGGDSRGGVVRAIQVPRVKAREVLKSPQNLVAADCIRMRQLELS